MENNEQQIFEEFSPETLENEQYNSQIDENQEETTNSGEQEASAPPLQNSQPSFKPESDQNVIAEISPGGFDNVMKILRVLIKSSSISSILIRQSQIVQETSSYFLEADMRNILKYNDNYIDLDITNPGKVVKKFEEFRNNGNIFVIDDDENSRYLITNGQVRLYLPKQDEDTNQEIKNYDLENAQVVASKVVSKNTRNSIRNLAKEADYIEYLVQDEEFKAISVPDGVFVFDEYINDTKAAKLDETNADLTLRSGSFLPVEAEEYNVYLVKLPDENYAVVSSCRVGQIPIQITESCDVTTGGNILI